MSNELRFRASMKDDVSKPIRGIEDAFGRIQKYGRQGFIAGATAAATTKAFDLMGMAASSAADFIKGSIDAASDLNETVSKTRVIFGAGAADIEKWGDAAADSFGQSKRAALDAASGFKGLFDVVGIGADKSTAMAKKLTELGSDLASFFNTDVSEALGALRSGLNGESEPLRRFNVFLSETAVAAKLAEMGIKKTGGSFTEAQKALARYEIILESTTAAQGDFARTSDGLANSSRTLEANIEDLQAKIGGPLSEAAKTATGAMLDLVDGLNAAADEAKPLQDRAIGLIEGLGSVADLANDLLNPALAMTEDQMKQAAEQSGVFASSARLAGRGGHAAAEGIEEAGGSADDLKRDFKELRKEADRLADELRDDLKSAAEDAADALAEAIYGPKELKGELAELRSELSENQAELRELEKIKNPTAAQRRDITETKGRLAETKAEILKTRVQLALLDGTGLKDLRRELTQLATRTDAAGDEARELLRLLNAISTVRINDTFSSTGQQGSSNRHRAKGGPVSSGAYTVGEEGQETLLMFPGGGGYVIPNSGSRSSGSGGNSTVVHVSIQPHPMATPGQAQAWAREAAPAILDEMKRRGVLR